MKKNRNIIEIILYIFIGGLTTLVNIIIFFILLKLKINYLISNIYANIFSIIFAYIGNKLIVFKNKNTEINVLLKELIKFFLLRIGTMFFDIIMMYLLISLFLVTEIASKVFVNILVIILNFIFSKYYVFKKTNVKNNRR